MLWTIIVMLIVGLIAGALARLLVPGKDPIGIGGTILLGIVGSFIGGFLGWLLFHHDAKQGAFQTVRPDRLGHRRGHRAADLPRGQRAQPPRGHAAHLTRPLTFDCPARPIEIVRGGIASRPPYD